MHTSVHTKIFLIGVGALVLVVAGHNYTRYYVARDYPLHVFAACDTTHHSCFVANPETADPTFQNAPYEKVMIDAAHAPSCLDEHTCADFTCDGIGGVCQVDYCSTATLEDGETCSSTQTQ